jgi:hypothetical protein
MISIPLASLPIHPVLPQLPLLSLRPQEWLILVMPFCGILIALVGLVGGLWFTDRNRRRRHETIRLALEKGQPIPEAILNEDEHGRRHYPRGPRRERDDRRSGLILIAVAGGVFLFFRAVGAEGPAWLAAIPGFIGVALVINSLLETRDGPPPAPPAA